MTAPGRDHGGLELERALHSQGVMKILMQTELYPPFVSGESVFAGSMSRALAARGHDVVVLTSSTNGPPRSERAGRVRVVRLASSSNPAYDTFRQATWPFGAAREVVERFEPDAIHVNDHGPIALALVALARRTGIPLLASNHFIPPNVWLNRPGLERWTGRLGLRSSIDSLLWRWPLWVYEQADLLTTPSRTAARILYHHGLRREAVPLSNGVDTRRFHPSRRQEGFFARWGVPEGAPVLLQCGRLYPSKLCSTILSAFDTAAWRIGAWLVIAGEGPDRPQLERQASGLACSRRIAFTGHVPDDLMPALYASSDLFVIASMTELQGIVVLEAMASGIPAIAVKAGALPELVGHGVTGALYWPDDRGELARHMVDLAHDGRLRLGPAARRLAERHGLQATCARLEEMLLSITRDGVAARAA